MTKLLAKPRVFPGPFTHGGICPPIYEGQVQVDKALMGRLMREDIDLMEGDLTLIDYIIN